MWETANNEQNPYSIWTKLMQETMLQNYQMPPTPATDATAVAPDAWNKLIEQLWQNNPYTQNLPYDPVEVTQVWQQIWQDAFMHPERYWSSYLEYTQKYSQIWLNAAMKFWGVDTPTEPVISPEKGDKRFSAPDWEQNAAFDALKQSYLLSATTLLKSTSEIKGLDEHQQHKLTFYLRQFIDAVSPTNYAFTNPQVIRETIQTGGQNLVKGTQNLLRDFQAGGIKMTDTEAFTPGVNLALTPGSVVYRNQLIELIQYKPTTEKTYAVPIVFIPPWINKFYILDMQPENSLIKFLVNQGFTVFVISWKNPDASMDEISFEDYMELGPLSAFKAIKSITGSDKINPVGYCIGGTLLSLTVPYLQAICDNTVNAVTFLVALQDFTEVGDTAVFIDEKQVDQLEKQMHKQGFLDSRSMATMFNMLRANDLIWSNVVNNYLLGKEPPAFDLLYWNNDGTRMTTAAHTFYLRNTYLENNLIKPCYVSLKNVPIDLGKIKQDIYAVGAQQDHIVPWKSAWRISQLTSGKTRFVLGGSGHIAGVINPPSKGRGYWTNDKTAATAEQWLESAEQHKGSWWTDWLEWLKPRSGELVTPPEVGNSDYPPLAPAPGTYVLEK